MTGPDPAALPARATQNSGETPAATIASSEPAALTQPDVAATRSKVVGVRLTEAEYAELKAVADRFGKSPPDLLRMTWFHLKDADDYARRSA